MDHVTAVQSSDPARRPSTVTFWSVSAEPHLVPGLEHQRPHRLGVDRQGAFDDVDLGQRLHRADADLTAHEDARGDLRGFASLQPRGTNDVEAIFDAGPPTAGSMAAKGQCRGWWRCQSVLMLRSPWRVR